MNGLQVTNPIELLEGRKEVFQEKREAQNGCSNYASHALISFSGPEGKSK